MHVMHSMPPGRSDSFILPPAGWLAATCSTAIVMNQGRLGRVPLALVLALTLVLAALEAAGVKGLWTDTAAGGWTPCFMS